MARDGGVTGAGVWSDDVEDVDDWEELENVLVRAPCGPTAVYAPERRTRREPGCRGHGLRWNRINGVGDHAVRRRT